MNQEDLEEFWQLFQEESEDALNNSEDCLLALKNNREDTEQINTLFRAIHTFKGSSRMMGLSGIESIAHIFEDIVGLVRDKGVPLDDNMYDWLFKTIDVLRTLLEKVLETRENYPIDDYQTLYNTLEEIANQHKETNNAEENHAPSEEAVETHAESEAEDNIQSSDHTNSEQIFEEENNNEEETHSESIEAINEKIGEESNTTEPAEDSKKKMTPNTDPVFVKVYMEVVEHEFGALDKLRDSLHAKDEAIVNDVEKILNSLIHASENMGYEKILYILERLHAELHNMDNDKFTETWISLEEDLKDKIKSLHEVNDKKIESAENENTENNEVLDKQTDPTYVKIFIDLAESELINLRQSLNQLAEGQSCQEEIFKIIETLRHASESMKYTRIITVLDHLCEIAKSYSKTEENNHLLGQAELQLREEFNSIFNVIDHDDSKKIKKEVIQSNNASSVFIHSYAKQAQNNIKKLSEIFEKISETYQKLKEGQLVELNKKLIDSNIKILKHIYQSCAFYSLNTAAQLTLVLEDLYSRIYQGEFTLSQKLIDVSSDYIETITSLFNQIENKEKIDEKNVEKLLKSIKNEVFINADNQLSHITNKVLEMIDLDEGFDEVLTPENVIEISEHLQNGHSFYNVLADLESSEEVAMQFYELCSKESLFPISNVTVYKNDKTLFLFLLASPLEKSELEEMIDCIDPQHAILNLSSCALKDSPESEEEIPIIEDFFDDYSIDSDNLIENDLLLEDSCEDINYEDIDIMGAVGQLVTAHSALTHLVEDINSNQLCHQIQEHILDEKNQSELLRKIQNATDLWSEDIKNHINQIMGDFASSLDYLKELSIQLRNTSMNHIIDPIKTLVRDTSFHVGKKVDFKTTSENKKIDKGIINESLESIRNIVWFIIIHSIEESTERKESNKSSIATIQFAIEKFDDHIQFIINDDGAGFSEAQLNQIANKHKINLKQLDSIYEVITHPLVGELKIKGSASQGLDFNRIQKDLAKKSGALKISHSQLGGNQYTLSLPLTSIVIDGMVVKIGSINYIIPIKAIRRILKPEDNMISQFSSNQGSKVIRLGEDLISVKNLSKGKKDTTEFNPDAIYVVIESDTSTSAFEIDELIGQQQILIHPLQGYLAEIPAISGCAVLAGGQIGMVIDVDKVTQLKNNG